MSEGPAPRGLLAQSFLTSLPIVLTVGLGFAANYAQSREQHREEMATLEVQAKMDREKQAASASATEKARHEEAVLAGERQKFEAQAKLDQQAREFDANALMAARRFAQEQLTLRSQHAAQQGQQAREFSQSLERQRRQTEADLLLQIMKVGDPAVARSNIEFLLHAGLVRDPDGRIASAARETAPVLPTASGALEVRVPTADSPEGRKLAEELDRRIREGRPAAPSLEGPLRELIGAISSERDRYSVRELAAMIALIEDETAGTFRRRPERCSRNFLVRIGVPNVPAELDDPACFELLYGARTRRGPGLGNREPGDGYRYRGRGYISLVGRANYQRMKDAWQTDYVGNPDLLDEPVHAFRVALTLSEPGLRALRSHRQFGVGDPAQFPFAEAMTALLRKVLGPAGIRERLPRIAARAATIETVLRAQLR